MKRLFAAVVGIAIASAMFASCSGNTEDDKTSANDNTGTTTTTTTVTTRATTTTRETETNRGTTTRDTDSSGSFMSQAESKLDEIGDDVADGIDATLSTAGDVADTILR